MKNISRRFINSLCLSTAILAIANVDSLVHQGHHDEDFAREKIRMARVSLRKRLQPAASQKVAPKGELLRESLTQDELGELVPFASLSNLEPLTQLLALGVLKFERTTYRSPEYQGESGYDLIHYEITHPDGRRSSILAYLDRPLLTTSRNVGTPDARVPVVVILGAQGESARYSLYRAGSLIEQSQLPLGEVTALVAQRVSASVPFFSVSR